MMKSAELQTGGRGGLTRQSEPCIPDTGGSVALKRAAFDRPHATRFRLLFLCMSLSQNRRTLLRDMH
ncbi:hypothetical protein MESS2_50011 [Mesorhizobium metallidurans STM 2683]|uniref:Uncharacterized protein n=1 Tax=Mesorhizobium metallidurans STM 2683 TaxID=1297569 RepID=M5ET25_9HYPH|nr:hypothetical protein MESS2_50011 [Mesorhizobium metallidurans STM 2683]